MLCGVTAMPDNGLYVDTHKGAHAEVPVGYWFEESDLGRALGRDFPCLAVGVSLWLGILAIIVGGLVL
jgi:hypothetical protein